MEMENENISWNSENVCETRKRFLKHGKIFWNTEKDLKKTEAFHNMRLTNLKKTIF